MDEQITMRMGTALRDRLDAARGSATLGEEIRQRLAASFFFDGLSPATHDLIRAVDDAARHTAVNFNDWHRAPTARECFRGAVNHMIDRIAVRGLPAPVMPKAGSFAAGLFGDRPVSPEEASRMIVSWTITEFNRRRDARDY